MNRRTCEALPWKRERVASSRVRHSADLPSRIPLPAMWEPCDASTPATMRLGSYDTVMPLGRGGMADLYLGRSDAGEVVVLKTLRSPTAPSQIAMFLEEGRFSQL